MGPANDRQPGLQGEIVPCVYNCAYEVETVWWYRNVLGISIREPA